MSYEVPKAFQVQFKDNFILLSQQRMSKFRAAVRTDPDFLKGKAGYFDRIGATAMVKRTSRHADTPLISTPHSRRRVTMDDFEWADLIDQQDKLRMIADPTGTYVRNAVMAANRKMDDVIITAMTGDAYSIDEDDAATTVAVPSAQIVAQGGAGMTLAKMIEARQILATNDVDLDAEPVYGAVSPYQMSQMLSTTEIKSADYNDRVLKDGKVAYFMGINWIETNRLPLDSSGDRVNPIWVPSAIGLAIGEDVTTDVGPRRDKSMSTQVYLRMSIGATRIEDEKIVLIKADVP